MNSKSSFISFLKLKKNTEFRKFMIQLDYCPHHMIYIEFWIFVSQCHCARINNVMHPHRSWGASPSSSIYHCHVSGYNWPQYDCRNVCQATKSSPLGFEFRWCCVSSTVYFQLERKWVENMYETLSNYFIK